MAESKNSRDVNMAEVFNEMRDVERDFEERKRAVWALIKSIRTKRKTEE